MLYRMESHVEDRSIQVVEIFPAPTRLVFRAWTDPDLLVQWWTPEDFSITIKSIDVTEGGVWRFVMHGPDNLDYANEIIYREIHEPEMLAYTHGGGEDISKHFEVTVNFAEEGSDKTILTMTMRFKSSEECRRAVEEVQAIEGIAQTFDRLRKILEKLWV